MRPTAAEIEQLLNDNPRLISPCIDVPLASLQIERPDYPDLLPILRPHSQSQSVSQQSWRCSYMRRLQECEDYGYTSDTYTSMSGDSENTTLVSSATHISVTN